MNSIAASYSRRWVVPVLYVFFTLALKSFIVTTKHPHCTSSFAALYVVYALLEPIHPTVTRSAPDRLVLDLTAASTHSPRFFVSRWNITAAVIRCFISNSIARPLR